MNHRLNYGAVGNCRTAALISETGNIEWLCLPEFDSPSIFAALLDREKGGCFGFEVSEAYRTEQSYIPHTNILSTHFISDEAEFTVLDFMPYYRAQNSEHYLPAELYRYVRRIRGVPRFRVHYAPAPDYARGKTIRNVGTEYIESYSSLNATDRQYLYSSIPLEDIERSREIVLEKDEFFLLSYNEKVIPVDIEREKLEYCRTLVYWLNWSNRTKKYTLYNDVIERSLLTLKLMSYYNGAMLAALTTSLPETVGEVRNWDYRFCWLRDASMSIETLFKVGHPGVAQRFMRFIQSTFTADRDSFQIMYGIRGERQLTETILEHLSGYKGSKPVRIGNDAYHQRQNDSFGPGTAGRDRGYVGAGEKDSGQRHAGVAQARQGNLGNQGRGAPFRLLQSDVLGSSGPRGQNRPDAGQIRLREALAAGGRAHPQGCAGKGLERGIAEFFPDL